MGKIIKIDNVEISSALKKTTRQYFVGNLFKAQQITFIRDERLEIGISSYTLSQSEPAHVHNISTEYQYVIKGWTEYMDIENGEIYEFRKGDFYAIETNTVYSQKVKAGTVILFIKVPSINDKQLVEMNAKQLEWLAEEMKTVRVDYYHREDAPNINSIKPAAAVAIINPKRELLMLHRKDNKKWTMPGGTLEYGESMTECALREVKEECGLDVNIVDIIGTYTDPKIRVAYSDGEVRQEFTIVYYGVASNYDVVLDEESSQFQWVSLDDILALPLADSQRRRIIDVLNYFQYGTRKMV